MKKQQRAQIILVLIGLFLIFSTYFYYPYMNKHKQLKSQSVLEKSEETVEADNSSNFENVEYKGLYKINNQFVVKSEEAIISNEEPDIVNMTNMRVVIEMQDGRSIVITSDKGIYNKRTYDCYFVDNVKATDEKTVLLSDNIDLLATKDAASVYNNVIITSKKGSLVADKVDYDFETKYYKVSMFDDTRVKAKIIEWVI